MFSALEVYYDNALYKFTFDIDIGTKRKGTDRKGRSGKGGEEKEEEKERRGRGGSLNPNPAYTLLKSFIDIQEQHLGHISSQGQQRSRRDTATPLINDGMIKLGDVYRLRSTRPTKQNRIYHFFPKVI